MKRSSAILGVRLGTIVATVALVTSVIYAASVQAAARVTTEEPFTLVARGVTSFVISGPKLFWHTGVGQCPPEIAQNTSSSERPADTVPDVTSDKDDIGLFRSISSSGASEQSPEQIVLTGTESIKRIATVGSPERALFAMEHDCWGDEIRSNLAADADFVYFLSEDGLRRLSIDANPNEPSHVLSELDQTDPDYSWASLGEVVDGGDRLFTIDTYFGEKAKTTRAEVSYVLKSTGERVVLAGLADFATYLSYDGTYVYYYFRNGGQLMRLEPGVDNGKTIATGVTGFHAEGNLVYVAKGSRVYIYDNDTNTLGATPVYTSPDATSSIILLASDSEHLFLFEDRGSFVLVRTDRDGISPADPIYTSDPYSRPENLISHGDFLFWQNGYSQGPLLRLPKNSTELPQVNIRVTGIEVTQGIQDLNNSVDLIKNRKTFVRVYVESVGDAVPGVTAQLTRSDLPDFPLSPVNPIGRYITVHSYPNQGDFLQHRSVLDQHFLFELPWGWTNEDNLQLQVILNPYRVPLEPDYADNNRSLSISFSESPTLSLEFFRLNYDIGGTTYGPRLREDVMATLSWLLRVYPIGGALGDRFRPRLWDVDGGARFGNWVDQSSQDCIAQYPNPDFRNLCASFYTNGRLNYYRAEPGTKLKTDAFYYGMISDGAGFFPRGQALGMSSVGPSGSPCSPNPGDVPCTWDATVSFHPWDTDGTYADWYAGHEIGHSLDRQHPIAGSDDPATPRPTIENCGHSRTDLKYPYGNTTTRRAPIGPTDNSMAGFDVGDPRFGIARAVLLSNDWNDLMSYCIKQWISDYTYEGMYDYMIANPSAAGVGSLFTAGKGAFLFVAGTIDPAAQTAAFSFIRRIQDAFLPPLVPGNYAIRLLDAQASVLATYVFTPEPLHDVDGLGFSQVVDFVAGTRMVQIVQGDGAQVLASVEVSSSPPAVSDVRILSLPSLGNSELQLEWTASDLDGDLLAFDIAYSTDNGATFQPITINVTGTDTVLDTNLLGGSTQAVLRVTVSDGIHTAFADSPTFTVALKPPQPYILYPGNPTQVHYGQLVNFNGVALDAQDNFVDSAGLAWTNSQGETLGVGALLSLDKLAVGTNVISMTATNSIGISATTTVTVIVDDDLSLPGPTLTVGPTQIAWHVAVGETEVQTASLSINNAGSGDLQWAVASDQAWLTMDSDTGIVEAVDTPKVLKVTADPVGLANDATYIAHLTIRQLPIGDNLEQTITIPVMLSIGNVFDMSSEDKTLFLPLLER